MRWTHMVHHGWQNQHLSQVMTSRSLQPKVHFLQAVMNVQQLQHPARAVHQAAAAMTREALQARSCRVHQVAHQAAQAALCQEKRPTAACGAGALPALRVLQSGLLTQAPLYHDSPLAAACRARDVPAQQALLSVPPGSLTTREPAVPQCSAQLLGMHLSSVAHLVHRAMPSLSRHRQEQINAALLSAVHLPQPHPAPCGSA
mmetsp:Transcript_125973/g.217432  ORF Transcript_125973/g.217432 Transcript_125973/m.217432 type:complete len:202 (+) Transcript_125973:65-670(+)